MVLLFRYGHRKVQGVLFLIAMLRDYNEGIQFCIIVYLNSFCSQRAFFSTSGKFHELPRWFVPQRKPCMPRSSMLADAVLNQDRRSLFLATQHEAFFHDTFSYELVVLKRLQ